MNWKNVSDCLPPEYREVRIKHDAGISLAMRYGSIWRMSSEIDGSSEDQLHGVTCWCDADQDQETVMDEAGWYELSGRLTRERDECRSEIVKLRAELDRTKKHAADMNNGWRKANFENHDLRAELAEVKESKQGHAARADAWKVSNENLRAELAAANNRIEHMSKVLVDAEELLGIEETGELILRPIERLKAGACQDAKKIARLTAALEDIADTFTHERWCRCGDALRQVARSALACRFV